MIGLFVATFETTDKNGIKTCRNMSGTASLHSQISKYRFTIRTAAHNLI